MDVPIKNGWIFPSFFGMLTRPGKWLEVGETCWLHHLRFFSAANESKASKSRSGTLASKSRVGRGPSYAWNFMGKVFCLSILDRDRTGHHGDIHGDMMGIKQ